MLPPFCSQWDPGSSGHFCFKTTSAVRPSPTEIGGISPGYSARNTGKEWICPSKRCKKWENARLIDNMFDESPLCVHARTAQILIDDFSLTSFSLASLLPQSPVCSSRYHDGVPCSSATSIGQVPASSGRRLAHQLPRTFVCGCGRHERGQEQLRRR